MGNLINLGVWPRGTLRPNGCLTPTGSLGSGQYDVQLSFAQAVALCWRVKRWKLDFEFIGQGDVSAPFPIPGTFPVEYQMEVAFSFVESASFQGELLVSSGPGNYTSRTAHSGFLPPQPSPATIVQTIERETDLICAGNNIYSMTTPVLNTTINYSDGFVENNSFRVEIVLSQIVDAALKARASILGNGTTNSRAGFRLVPEPSGALAGGALRFLGNQFEIPFRSYNRGTQGVPPSQSSGPTVSYYETTAFRFILEPAAYWAYDPLDQMGPIYDEATGNRLRPNPL